MTEENKSDGKNEADPYANDPFFKRIFDGQWNACIGRQGHEENYIDGYIEAAIELADAIFEKQLVGKRDTLVLPILYNARHCNRTRPKICNRASHRSELDQGRRAQTQP